MKHGGIGFKKVFGIRAVVGHTAVGFLEDDRLLMPLYYVKDKVSNTRCSHVLPTTRISSLNSIIINGLAPDGDGITNAVHSQLSAFHMMDYRLQESRRASMSGAVILYNAEKWLGFSEFTQSHGVRPASTTAFLKAIVHHVEGR